jgi:tRNA threonylcarbamoyladenosine biosynthesis protein TsaE
MTQYMTEMRRSLATEADTLALGQALAPCIAPGLVIYLVGELGAGKTTLARGLLRGLGYAGKVKSPTFTLVEVYELSRLYLYHFDFYRFNDPRELGEAGFRAYFNPQSVCLVEWPERSNQAAGLPAADLRIVLEVAGSGRNVSLFADSEAGASCLTRFQAQFPP